MKARSALLFFILLLLFPASSRGETLQTEISLSPRGETLFSNALSPANLGIKTSLSSPRADILPTRRIRLDLPGYNTLRMGAPASMPVCPDSALGPNSNNSVPAAIMVARCPRSVLGNGLAKFFLAKNNNSESSLDGQVLLFHGGSVSGLPRIKFWAYSYDTGVAIYTQALLERDGTLNIPIPYLSYDSAISLLDVSIPGKTERVFLPRQDITITLPGGMAPNYIQALCPGGFLFSTQAFLGPRTTDSLPIGDDVVVETTQTEPCSGQKAIARLGAMRALGKGVIKRGQKTVYRVSVSNRGRALARGVAVSLGGRRVSLGTIPAGGKRVARFSFVGKKRGKQTLLFRASSANGGKSSVRKNIIIK